MRVRKAPTPLQTARRLGNNKFVNILSRPQVTKLEKKGNIISSKARSSFCTKEKANKHFMKAEQIAQIITALKMFQLFYPSDFHHH